MSDARSRPDACPGALTLHEAADGPLARIRLAGHPLSPPQLEALARAATDFSDGFLELTSRANVQLRGVRDRDALAAALSEPGLLPSRSHERVRNVVASPRSGRTAGTVDVTGWVDEYDAGLCADPGLTSLPGRVLTAFDDGTGDMLGLRADITVLPADEGAALVLAGADTGLRAPLARAADFALTAARAFAALRGDRWRIGELDGGIAPLVAAVAAELGIEPLSPHDGRPHPDSFPPAVQAEPPALTAQPGPPVGWLDQADGQVMLGAAVPLGRLSARLCEFLAAVDRPLVVTPWRTIALRDLDEFAAEQVVRVLAPMGLVFDAESPWLRVTACAGRPGCAKALADVRADAAGAVALGVLPDGGPLDERRPTHFAGCERRCGRPAGEAIDVVATGAHYRVDRPTPAQNDEATADDRRAP